MDAEPDSPSATFTPVNSSTPIKPDPEEAENATLLKAVSKSTTTTTPKKTKLPPIPTSLEAVTASDRLILRLRDEEQRNWDDINKEWMAQTGILVGKSTLRMRYTTMKSNFVDMDGEDEARMLRAKKEVEEKFEGDKWRLIADAVESAGGKNYPVGALLKRFKEMNKPARYYLFDHKCTIMALEILTSYHIFNIFLLTGVCPRPKKIYYILSIWIPPPEIPPAQPIRRSRPHGHHLQLQLHPTQILLPSPPPPQPQPPPLANTITTTTMSTPTLHAIYSAPQQTHTFEQTITSPLPSNDADPSAVPAKVTYLAELRKLVSTIQNDINVFLTERMEDDKKAAEAQGQKVSEKEAKEEENYGEEVVEEDA
ncbi:Gon7-domain-containing protein [Aspergillus ibericus CBS 121593]|uniref:EKC/KEOPS complex subunit GON7 n=1 Tax=Aspergillus ibericus CBS 121593 TaxID=1448316 RepID=A0A395GQV7_9EURO|nr:Gon7-domain-containing protein [Aspergillus ibericus CBS 121593]RAK97921.1 Gon7-domain-containing protein [Aspergillus ibericus CBS 121593]